MIKCTVNNPYLQHLVCSIYSRHCICWNIACKHANMWKNICAKISAHFNKNNITIGNKGLSYSSIHQSWWLISEINDEKVGSLTHTLFIQRCPLYFTCLGVEYWVQLRHLLALCRLRLAHYPLDHSWCLTSIGFSRHLMVSRNVQWMSKYSNWQNCFFCAKRV